MLRMNSSQAASDSTKLIWFLSLGDVRGVGHDEDSFAAVQRSNVGSSPHAPSRAIPQVGQVPENGTKEPSRFAVEETGNILCDDPSRANLANDTGKFGPEVTIVSRRLTLSCNGMRLAREPTGDDSLAASTRPRGETPEAKSRSATPPPDPATARSNGRPSSARSAMRDLLRLAASATSRTSPMTGTPGHRFARTRWQ
jgi:hypothetical protein